MGSGAELLSLNAWKSGSERFENNAETGISASTANGTEVPKRNDSAKSSKQDGNADFTESREILLIGEPVQIRAMQYLLQKDFSIENVRLVCPMADAPKELMHGTEVISVEESLREVCRQANLVIADPIYARLLPETPERFVSLPHEAYSGRHYREDIPVFIGPEFTDWMGNVLQEAGRL